MKGISRRLSFCRWLVKPPGSLRLALIEQVSSISRLVKPRQLERAICGAELTLSNSAEIKSEKIAEFWRTTYEYINAQGTINTRFLDLADLQV